MTFRQLLKNLLWPQDFEWYPCPYDNTAMTQYGFYLHSLWCPLCKNGPLKGMPVSGPVEGVVVT